MKTALNLATLFFLTFFLQSCNLLSAAYKGSEKRTYLDHRQFGRKH